MRFASCRHYFSRAVRIRRCCSGGPADRRAAVAQVEGRPAAFRLVIRGQIISADRRGRFGDCYRILGVPYAVFLGVLAGSSSRADVGRSWREPPQLSR